MIASIDANMNAVVVCWDNTLLYPYKYTTLFLCSLGKSILLLPFRNPFGRVNFRHKVET